jgi:hypothetical protein
MTLNPQLKAAQLALNSATAYRKFIRIDEGSAGEIVFTNIATGQQHGNMGDAISGVDSLGLVDYRLFSPRAGQIPFGDFRSTAGANQIESEILKVNEFLREATSSPEKMQQLRNVGLERFAGQSLDGRMFKFNTGGQKDIVTMISSEFPVDKVATASMTDEGYTLLQYVGTGGLEITGRESKMLQSIVGVGPIQTSFIKKLLETDDYTSISKLAKRLQSTMSPRNVALGQEFIEGFLDKSFIDASSGVPMRRAVPFESRTVAIDGVAGQLEIMLRDRGIEGAGLRPSEGLIYDRTGRDARFGDRILGFSDTPRFRLTDQERFFQDAGAMGQDLNMTETLSRVDQMDQRLTIRRKRLLEQMSETYGFTDDEIDRVAALWDQATADAASDRGAGTEAEKILKAFKTRTKNLFDDEGGTLSKVVKPELSTAEIASGRFEGRDLQGKIGAMINGLDKSRDGQYMITPTLLRDIKAGYEGQLQSMLRQSSAPGFTNFTREQSQDIRALQKQIEAINKALEKTGKGDIIARINLGIGQFKGEAYIVPDRIAANFTSDQMGGMIPYVIGDVTNVKGEVGSSIARNILFDIGEEKSEVFSDPLMFLYHGDYFSQPNMIRTMQENAMATIGKTQEFMDSGVIPSEVMRNIEQEVSGLIGGNNLSSSLKFESGLLDPISRASHLRNRQEAQEIMNALQSGMDPRQIPQLVRRINDFYNGKVVRLKNGRADVVMPTANRFSLRTLESKLDEGRGFSPMQSIGLDPSTYGFKLDPGTPEQLNFVNFRIKGKSMLLAGEAAYKYQHSLGGFDLDDKGIPLMSTFFDKSGRKRLAFMTLRQPTSFQESLAMTADLTDAGTVEALFKGNSKFKQALTDSTLLSNLGIDKNSEQYLNLTRMVSGKGSKVRDVDYDAIEDMIIKISESSAVYGGELPSFTTTQVAKMARDQSPSSIGLDEIREGSPLHKHMLDLGLDPSENPAPYSSETIFQIFRKQSEAHFNESVLRQASQELGFEITDKDELVGFLEGRGARYTPGMEHKVSAIVREFVTDVMEKSADSSVEESIGLFINRQAASVSVLESSRTILEKEFGARLGDELFEDFQKAASIFTLPGSEAVDISKQIKGFDVEKQIRLEQVLTSYGEALHKINQEMGITKEMAEETLKAYMTSAGGFTEDEINNTLELLDAGKINLGLDPLGQQMLRAHAGVGFVRAKQIAEQVGPGSTAGALDRSKLLRTRANHLRQYSWLCKSKRLRPACCCK